MGERKKQSVLNGALILTIGMLGVKLVGVMFKMPLGNMIGTTARGYFDAAYNIYLPIFAISMAGLPVAVSRMVSENVALNRYRDARSVFRVAKWMYALFGVAGTLVLLVIAFPYAEYVSGAKTLAGVIAIAPSMLFCTAMSAYRGYYNGLSNMTPTAVSQFIEAAGKLVFGLAFAKAIVVWGSKSYEAAAASGETVIRVFGTVAQNKMEADVAIYAMAAAGAILGVTVGSFLALIYSVLYARKKGSTFTRVELVNSPRPQLNTEIAKRLVAVAVPMMLSALILNLTNLIDTVTIQSRILAALENDFDAIYKQFRAAFDGVAAMGLLNLENYEEVRTYLWGAYGMAMDFRTLVPTLTTAFGVSALPALSAAWAVKDKDGAKTTVNTALRYMMMIALPAGIGMAVLAKPILTLIYGRGSSAPTIDIVQYIMVVYGLTTALMSISTPVSNMLQAVGRTDIPIRSILVAAFAKIAINFILVGNPRFTIYGAVIGTVVFYLIVTVYNVAALLRITKVPLQLGTVIVKPLIASLLSGAAAFVSYHACVKLIVKLVPALDAAEKTLNAGNLSTLIAVGVAALVYAIALLLSRSIQKDEVLGLPKGEKIAKVLEKYRLLG